MARRPTSCSIGWCVGPSSPTPIESCVKTWIAGISISAARRIGGLHVVGEDQEGRTEGADAAERHAVDDRAHGVLADAEMHVAAARRAGLEIARAVEGEARLGRGREVGRAADEPGIRAAQRRSAPCPRNRGVATPLASAAKLGRSASQPAGSSPAMHLVELLGRGRDVRCDSAANSFAQSCRCLAPRLPMPSAKCSRTPSGTRNCASSGQP